MLLIFNVLVALIIWQMMDEIQYRVKPSPKPDNMNLNEMLAADVVMGTYLALVTVLFY